MNAIREWFQRHFSDPQVLLLVLLLVGGLAVILLLGGVLAPILTALVIAYVLESPVQGLRERGVPHLLAVGLAFVGFLALLLFALLAVLPLLSQQITQLLSLLPNMVTTVQDILLRLPDQYPQLIDRNQVIELTASLRSELLSFGQSLLVFSLDQFGNLLTVGVYLFLVPLLVFFFLKDKDRLIAWVLRFLPEERPLATRVWVEVDQKIGAYMRGKIYEIGIIGSVTWVAFTGIGLDFAILLAVFTGLSVLIPYIGVFAVALPVALAAFFQFGWGGQFAAVLGAYAVIQLVDGNLLAPLLISEVVDLHPIAVIAAVLIFGGIWGFWGVFFAIPLATLAVAVLNAWPREPAAAAAASGGG